MAHVTCVTLTAGLGRWRMWNMSENKPDRGAKMFLLMLREKTVLLRISCLIKQVNTETITVSWSWAVISNWDSGIIIMIINGCDTSYANVVCQFGLLTPRSFLRDPADEPRLHQMSRDVMKGKWKPRISVRLPAFCPLNFSDNSIRFASAFPLLSFQIISSLPHMEQKPEPPREVPSRWETCAVINTFGVEFPLYDQNRRNAASTWRCDDEMWRKWNEQVRSNTKPLHSYIMEMIAHFMMCNKHDTAIYSRGDKGMLGMLKISMLAHEAVLCSTKG